MFITKITGKLFFTVWFHGFFFLFSLYFYFNRSQNLAKQTSSSSTTSAVTPGPGLLKRPSAIADDKDKQLQEKEAELKRMQEMVAQMQQQIKQQSKTSLASDATSN